MSKDIAIINFILKSALVCFSLLCASDYVDSKGPVRYVSTLYTEYSYSELSILSLYILSQDTPAEVHLLLLYLDAQEP